MIRQNKEQTGQLRNIGLAISLAFTIAACSGGSDTQVNVEPVNERPTEPPQLNSATTFDGPLVKAGQVSTSRFLKNGIYSAAYDNANFIKPDQPEQTTGQPGVDSAFATSNATRDFSTTNTQESGVDEADRIEYDGDTLYLATYPEWHKGTSSQSKVRILDRQDDFSLHSEVELSLLDENANINGMYKHNDRLGVLSTNVQVYPYDTLSFAPEPWFFEDQKVNLDIYDTSESNKPTTLSNIQVDGSMISSRRIGDDIYLVTSYTAYVEGLNPNATTEEELLANYLTILDTPDAELMPKIYRDGDDGTPLNSVEDCVIPAQATDKDGYAHLLTVSRINLVDPNDVQSSCISSVANMVYMSEASLYLSSTFDNQTILHKLSLDAELTYQATGKADGIIGWRGAPNLRLSEQDGFLRIVTSDYTQEAPVHKLSVLNQQGNELNVVSQLPNDLSPEPIGKPGEDIYAVRFFGDRGYIVTFERIDPLYVIDLSNPNAPSVVGALEIPGFSNYLHPLDNGYLLGIGQEVNINNIPEEGDVVIQPVTQEGVKISLFDVSDPSHPIEVNSVIKPDSYTPVEYDYRALTVLNDNGSYKFAMPIESWNRPSGPRLGIWSSSYSLMMLEVDTTINSPELIKRGELYPTLVGPYSYGSEDRSVIHGDNVYYIHGNTVWHTTWAEDAEVKGPY